VADELRNLFKVTKVCSIKTEYNKPLHLATQFVHVWYLYSSAGAILSGCWNSDGSEIVTAGEDGCVKVWSRIGMLRTTLNQCPEPIYAAVWSPDGQAVIHTAGQSIVIKPIQSGPKKQVIRWKAHDGVILCLASSSTSGLFVSGA